jgi:hypothetical protein
MSRVGRALTLGLVLWRSLAAAGEPPAWGRFRGGPTIATTPPVRDPFLSWEQHHRREVGPLVAPARSARRVAYPLGLSDVRTAAALFGGPPRAPLVASAPRELVMLDLVPFGAPDRVLD